MKKKDYNYIKDEFYDIIRGILDVIEENTGASNIILGDTFGVLLEDYCYDEKEFDLVIKAIIDKFKLDVEPYEIEGIGNIAAIATFILFHTHLSE